MVNLNGVNDSHEPLSERAQKFLNVDDLATSNYKAVYEDRWCPHTNPHGKINLCTAINNQCEDILEAKFHQLFDGESIWNPTLENIFNYPVPGGYERTKTAIIPFLERFLQVENILAENLMLTPGCTASYDMLSFCLCQPDDVVLTAAPFYGRIVNNFEERGGAKVIPVPFVKINQPSLDISRFQEVYDTVIAQGKTVKVLVIINPHNPFGVVFSSHQVVQACNWATKHGIFVVVDEIFATSVFRNINEFKSILRLRDQLSRPENIIWLWGSSKDLCMPGLKFAVIHTERDDLQKCLRRLEILQSIAPSVQNFIVKFMRDLDWLENVFDVTKRNRLREHYDLLIEELDTMQVPYVPATAGFFIMLNMNPVG